jgi:hypothetical protein
MTPQEEWGAIPIERKGWFIGCTIALIILICSGVYVWYRIFTL